MQIVEILQKYSQKGELPKLPADTIEGVYHFAYQFYLNGKYAEAIQFFRFLTLVDTCQRKHWMGLGAALQMQKEYEQAIHTYSVAAVLEAKEPYVHIYAADCFFALERIEEGMQALNSALKIAGLKNRYQPLIPELQLLRDAWERRIKHEQN
jgi:type III secretion system low calcium response chaperone LcrH/SycD